MIHRSISILAIATPLLMSAVCAQAASRYRLVDLGADTSGVRLNGGGQVIGFRNGLPSKYIGTWVTLEQSSDYQPSALNDKGVGVGWQLDGEPKAIVWTANDKTKAVIHGAVESVATTVDKNGVIYGSTQMPSGHSFPYMVSHGKVTKFTYLDGYNWTVPNSVNRFGEMAGFAGFDAAGTVCPAVPAIYQNGTWTSLGLLGGSCGIANGINDGGVVVGWSNTSGFYSHAFIYTNGQMSDLGTLGANENSIAWDITQDGVIVGDSGKRAFIYEDGQMIVLSKLVDNVPFGVKLQSARSINGKGQILVNGSDGQGSEHAYRLDPQ